MKCPKCNGTGDIGNGMWMCCECQGTGFIEDEKPSEPMTEEEWLRTATTEELVQAIHLMTTCCYVCGKEGVDYKRCYFRKNCTGPKEIAEWLKQPHSNE